MADTLNLSKPSLVPCDKLRQGPHQPRDKASIAAQVAVLVQCFTTLGESQLVPIIALPDGRIVDGHCRWEACKIVGRDCLVVLWHGETPPTPEQVARINASQSQVIPPGAMVEKWEKLIRAGVPRATIAKAEGRSEDKMVRRTKAVNKLKQAGVDTSGMSGASIDKEAARLTKEADKAKAGTVDARGRVRQGTASEARAEASQACQSARGGRTGNKGDTVDQPGEECPGCVALLARLEKVKASRASVRQELAEALARVEVLESGEVGKLRAQVEALRDARDKWKEKAEGLAREKRAAMGED